MLKRALSTGSLFLAAVLVAHGQSKEHYPVCFASGGLLVGEIPDRPFTAHAIRVDQRITQSGVGDSYGAPEAQIGFVARDREGRVSTRWRPELPPDATPDDRTHYWQVLICDPATGRNTTIGYLSADASLSGEGLPLLPSDATRITAMSRAQDKRTTAIFGYWHNTVKGRDNLGEEPYEGLSAYRYRLTPASGAHTVRDIVNSDELSLQLVQTTWKQYPNIEESLHLTGIEQGQPSPELFEVPDGLHVEKF